MSRVRVKVISCDRCPIGREKKATRTMHFGLGETRWKIDLCEDHGAELERQIESWGRLGEEESASAPSPRFDALYIENAKHAAELRAKQSREDAAKAQEAARHQANTVEVFSTQPIEDSPVPQTRSVSGKAWNWTEHARQRAEERGVDIVAALWAANSPERSWPGDRPPSEVRVRGKVKAIVDPGARVILTVAIMEREDGSSPASEESSAGRA